MERTPAITHRHPLTKASHVMGIVHRTGCCTGVAPAERAVQHRRGLVPQEARQRPPRQLHGVCTCACTGTCPSMRMHTGRWAMPCALTHYTPRAHGSDLDCGRVSFDAAPRQTQVHPRHVHEQVHPWAGVADAHAAQGTQAAQPPRLDRAGSWFEPCRPPGSRARAWKVVHQNATAQVLLV